MTKRTTAWAAGTPSWVDYAADDVDAARDFYRELLGWEYTQPREEFGGYINCLVGEAKAAGLIAKMDPGMPTAWTTYFATDDIDATTRAIGDAGGTVHAGPHEVGTLGKMVIAADPQGQMFGVWEAGEHIGFEVSNEPGGVVWNEAAMPDPSAAREFYGSVFGFSFEPVDGAPDYTMMALNGAPVGGLGGQTSGDVGGWQVCFAVASTDDAVAVVTTAGGTVIQEPSDTPFGRFAVVRDPWGASMEFMSEASAGQWGGGS